MKIWIDADSCPIQIRDIIIRGADRLKVPTFFVANSVIPGVSGEMCEMVLVNDRDQSADDYIITNSHNEDLAITRDIPLAAALVEKGIVVLDDRGAVFTKENIKERLSMRNIMTEFRENGLVMEKTKPLGKKEIKDFAAAFDREMTKKVRKNSIEI